MREQTKYANASIEAWRVRNEKVKESAGPTLAYDSTRHVWTASNHLAESMAYLEVGLFRRFAEKADYSEKWIDDIEEDCFLKYWLLREKGYAIAYARTASKRQAQNSCLRYTENYKAWNAARMAKHRSRVQHTTDQLNALGHDRKLSKDARNNKIESLKRKLDRIASPTMYQPRETLSIDSLTHDDDRTVILSFLVADNSDMRTTIKRIYSVCRDSIDRRIITGMLKKRSRETISRMIEINKNSIYRRLRGIGGRYKDRYITDKEG